MNIRIRSVVPFVAVLVLPVMALAQPVLIPDSSLTGDDPDGTSSAFGDAYGAAADTWGDWLFVGAPRETTFRDGFDQQDGAVYIYRKVAGAYVFQQKLTMPGSSGLVSGAFPIGDRFGGGIAAEAGWLFVGAANDQDFPGLVDPRPDPDFPPFSFAGQVHIYQFNGSSWDFVQTLIAPVPGTFGQFGTRTQASHIALDSLGKVAVIGELDNFEGGVGQLHTYRLKMGTWQYVQTLEAPLGGLDSFGDALVFANDKYLVAGGGDFSDDGLTAQGYVFVYQTIGESGKVFGTPAQAVAGPIIAFADCFLAPGFGEDGLDAAGGVVAIANPCATGVAGAFAGAVYVYRLVEGSGPLVLETTIEGDEPDLYFGANTFGARHAVAVSEFGGRILIGSPLSPDGGLFPTATGADVRVYSFDGLTWTEESNLTSPTIAAFRNLGDTVFFLDDETGFVRESNFLDPIVTGLKGQGQIYDLTP